MLFDKQKSFLRERLREIGADVTESRENYLCVDDKYEICYTNLWYRKKGEKSSLGQGAMGFIKIIEQEYHESRSK